MSSYDRQQGMFDGVAIGAGSTARRYGAAIDNWENYSNELEAKLAKANASRVGIAQLVRAISAELQRVDPNNPLLDKSRQIALVESQMVKSAAGEGYAYDPATDTIAPIR